jgi:hypothetical protein
VDVPFSTAQFLEVFARYDQAVWPAPVVFSFMAVAAVLLALRPAADSGRSVMAMLAFFWGWMAAIVGVAGVLSRHARPALRPEPA